MFSDQVLNKLIFCIQFRMLQTCYFIRLLRIIIFYILFSAQSVVSKSVSIISKFLKCTVNYIARAVNFLMKNIQLYMAHNLMKQNQIVSESKHIIAVVFVWIINQWKLLNFRSEVKVEVIISVIKYNKRVLFFIVKQPLLRLKNHH